MRAQPDRTKLTGLGPEIVGIKDKDTHGWVTVIKCLGSRKIDCIVSVVRQGSKNSEGTNKSVTDQNKELAR